MYFLTFWLQPGNKSPPFTLIYLKRGNNLLTFLGSFRRELEQQRRLQASRARLSVVVDVVQVSEGYV